jgi:hypothetical protein
MEVFMKNFLFGLLAGSILMFGSVVSFNQISNQSSAQAQPIVPGYYQQVAWGSHPEMDAALNLLIKAKEHLNNAAHDFDGHRVKAIEYTDRAIHEVRDGINYANNH